jgi:hypothetical protein
VFLITHSSDAGFDATFIHILKEIADVGLRFGCTPKLISELPPNVIHLLIRPDAL